MDIMLRIEGTEDIAPYLKPDDVLELMRVAKQQAREIERLRAALEELHAVVWGECPSLLNEDSGGDAGLDLRIRELIADEQKGDKS